MAYTLLINKSTPRLLKLLNNKGAKQLIL